MKNKQSDIFLERLKSNESFTFPALTVAVTTLLVGCAMPGFSSPETSQSSANFTSSRQHIIGYRPVVEPAPGASLNDVPDGAVIPISVSLIQNQQKDDPRLAPVNVRNLIGIAPVYTIGPSDVIGVLVYDHPELLPNAGAVISQQADPTGVSVVPGFIVSANGEISFPYIGRVKIQGLTEIEASDLIAKRISEFIKNPQVTVRIQSFRSRRAYVEGEVRAPGLQIFTDVPMTLAEAISRSGGINTNGDRSNITLTRRDTTINLDLPYLQDVGIDASKIPLLNGDIINVKNRDERKVYVMGEVLRPSALLMRNGKLSLNEALGDSGGPNLLSANTGQIYVIRNNAKGATQIYHLNAKNPAALALADKFILSPRDVVYIDPVGLVVWNRIVSLILPSAQVVNVGSEVSTR